MYENLQDLCEYYMQDFDIIFKTDVGPVDMYCSYHDSAAQKQLLADMEAFLKEVEAGTKSEEDLEEWNLEYIPSEDGSWDWFRDAMVHLKKKIAEG
jgi:hypothetical protein